VGRALQVAQSEPCGPVYLSLPREIVYRSLETARFPTAAELGIPRPAAPDPEAVRELIERLIRARNPVIVAGGGRNPQTVPRSSRSASSWDCR
jgi:acetolactate synthase-1/2/3 large subunit